MTSAIPAVIVGHNDGIITFLIACMLLSPNDFAALKTLIPTEERCAFVKRKIYGNKAIAITKDAPYIFLIDGNMILKPLKYSETGLAYSKIPTNMKA